MAHTKYYMGQGLGHVLTVTLEREGHINMLIRAITPKPKTSPGTTVTSRSLVTVGQKCVSRPVSAIKWPYFPLYLPQNTSRSSKIAFRNLILVRRAGKPFRHLGSAVMRGDQLAGLVRPHLSTEMRVSVVPFHAGLMPPMAMRLFALSMPTGSVVVFVKSAAKGLTAEHLEPLRRRDARIGLDSIDLPLDAIDFDLFDFHIAASLAGKAALEERLSALGMVDIPVEQLHHHYDPMIPTLAGKTRPFRCGYVGELPNAFIPRQIADEIDCVNVRYARDFTTALHRIAEFTLHYGVRPILAPRTSGARQYKPFTKGFTAAAFDANILVNREADDAVSLLGKDYPFFVSASDPDSVVDGFERAKNGAASPEWREGLERMRALRELVSPAALAARVREIVSVVSA